MRRFLLLLVLSFASALAGAGEVQDVLRLWAQQAGRWEGHIEIFGPDSSTPQTLGLVTRWDAVPDSSIVTKLETFSGARGDSSAVTLMYADTDPGRIVTPYFVNGKQRNYHFSVVSVSVVDDTHWTTVIASPGEQEVYEDRPAVLRYVRERRGNVIENTKEVRFLDDEGAGEYELRSLIRQMLVVEKESSG